jgi:predicted ArsR family transcriptional regulator
VNTIKNRILLKLHEKPGITTAELADALHIPARRLRTHVYQISHAGLICAIDGKRYPARWSLVGPLRLRRVRHERRAQVLAYLKQQPATTPELSERLGIARNTIHHDVNALLDAHKIRRVGLRRFGASVWGAA